MLFIKLCDFFARIFFNSYSWRITKFQPSARENAYLYFILFSPYIRYVHSRTHCPFECLKTVRVLCKRCRLSSRNFEVLLTVRLSIFVLVITQLDAQNLFYNKFISCLYIFRAPCAHRQEVKIVLHSIWYHPTYRCPSGAQVERGSIVKQILCIKLANY